MTREEMIGFVQTVLENADTPDVLVELTEKRDAAVRFGQNMITQNLDTFQRRLKLTLGDGERKAVYTTHRVDTDAIPEILGEAMNMLRTASPDPEYMPVVDGGQIYPVVDEWDDSTADASPDHRIGAAGKAVAAAKKHHMEASGLAGVRTEVRALGTSTGNLAHHGSTRGYINITMDKGRGSSYRALSSVAWKDLPIDKTIEEVAAEALADLGQAKLEPGSYRLIFEPQAVADLIPYIAWTMNARPADEGLTAFTDKHGKRVTGENFTLRSVVDGILKGNPFSHEGLASLDTVWIENGVLLNQPCERFWAKKTNREPLFIPGTLAIDGGEGEIQDLTAGITGRALLFRRFWYIRFVDQKELSLTGMTRDGVYLVEDGKILHPIEDFRWNWKPMELFSKIERTGTPERKGQYSVPPMVIAETKLG